MKDFLFFDKMLVPKLITLIYWALLLAAAITGLGSMFSGYGGFSFGKFIMGIVVAVSGAFFSRIWCELMIVLFKIHEALQEIRQK